MEITEVRVKLLTGRSDRLRAFCSMTIDDEFVVHDLRVIDGRKGMFVAMPSRKLSDNCPNCGGKNHLRAAYCNDCGSKLDENRADDRDKYHVDVAHPIVTSCRDKVQSTVLEAYHEEVSEEKEEPEGAQEPDEALEEDHDSEPVEAGEAEEEEEEEEYFQESEKAPAKPVESDVEEAEEEEPEPVTPAAPAEEEPETLPVEEEAPEEEEPEEEEVEEETEEEEETPEESGGFGAGIFG